MATVNLGRIRQVWRGAWATGTAYVKDDVVQEGVNSYICVNAHTAGATFAGDSANWQLMVQGADIPSQSGQAGKALITDGTNLSWGDGGGVLQVKKTFFLPAQGIQSNSYYGTNTPRITITPKAADSAFYINVILTMALYNHDSNAVFNVHDSQLGSDYNNASQHCFNYKSGDAGSWSNANAGYANIWSTGSDGLTDDYRADQAEVSGLYVPSYQNTNSRTFATVVRTHLATPANGVVLNGIQTDHPHHSSGVCHMEVWEIAAGAL